MAHENEKLDAHRLRITINSLFNSSEKGSSDSKWIAPSRLFVPLTGTSHERCLLSIGRSFDNTEVFNSLPKKRDLKKTWISAFAERIGLILIFRQ